MTISCSARDVLEALHNYTNKGDSRLAEQLGVHNGQSQDINPVLAANDCI